MTGSVPCIALALALGVAAYAQAPQPAPPSQPAATQQPVAAPIDSSQAGGVTEDQIRQLLVGKSLYLRGGYLDSSLSFDEYGRLIGHSPQGSYTLNLVQIDKIHLAKHKLELEGVRYGLHFLSTTPGEDPTKAVDKVRITPRKRLLKITIDRELVVTPKKKKGKKGRSTSEAANSEPATAQPHSTDETANTEAGNAAEPEAEFPADAKSVTTTTSQAHAAQLLEKAIGNVFAEGLDGRMIATMPAFWKLYYQTIDAHTEFRPNEPGVFLQDEVDQKAKLLTNIEPPSNEYAQAGGVAGIALYHAVIGADGKPEEIVVGRPIGFGLDENAVDTIAKASFQPAIKDGKPVPVLLDLLVQFRIFSKRTAELGSTETANKPAQPVLPGPYSVEHP
ncbi:MAG: energy transducer TonB [Terracidiphilus sp.]